MYRTQKLATIVIVSNNRFPDSFISQQTIATKSNKYRERYVGSQNGKYATSTRTATILPTAAVQAKTFGENGRGFIIRQSFP